MASGGRTRRLGKDPDVPGRRQAGTRTRTALVMDQLLSRGPVVGQRFTAESGGHRASGPWTSVGYVLRTTAPSILERHLTWVVAQTPSDDHLSPRRALLEDQARILITALEERDEDEVVSRALDQGQDGRPLPDQDNEIITYATALRRATEGQPDDSPYVALAQSAARVLAESLGHRRSSTPPPRVPGRAFGP
jgi:hypothetical protein